MTYPEETGADPVSFEKGKGKSKAEKISSHTAIEEEIHLSLIHILLWEMYVEIKVTDTGKGISESNQAAIFRRFYREEEVHEQQGLSLIHI